MRKPLKVLMLGPGLHVKGGVTAVEKLIVAHMPDSVHLRFISTMEDGSNVMKAFVFLLSIVRVFGLLLVGWPDVVHLHFTSRGSNLRKMTLARLAMLFRRRVIMHGHGGEFHLFVERLKPWYRKFTLKTLQRSNLVICLSESWREYYLTLGIDPPKLVALPNPVLVPDAVPNRSNRQRIQFLYLGLMSELKGVYDLLQAFASLPDSTRQKAQLVMAGNGELDKVRQIAAEIGIQGSVTVYDWVGPTERDRLLEESDVFLLPSYIEGLPMGMLEAMSYGMPVITTPVGGIPEYVKDGVTGLLIEPGAVDALAKAMETLIESEEMRLRIGAAGRDAVKPLDARVYCDKLAKLYSSVME
ncbi:MAG: glycosyltransferase family 4 protein [Fimbriimonadales bacterium]|nr:glycosyltransferase family 4 protein [Fimbriimonadales bacterium]